MKKTKHVVPRTMGLALMAVCLMVPALALGSSISGNINNNSAWRNSDDIFPPPPGAGEGQGALIVGVWSSSGQAVGTPLKSQTIKVKQSLPLSEPYPPYTLGSIMDPLADGGYYVLAWIDGNDNGKYELGEPASPVATVQISDSQPVQGVNLTVIDDSDNDQMPDWWEAHWFSNLTQNADNDPDGDKLTNVKEYQIYAANVTPNNVMKTLNPAHWDSDGDGMDDRWEYEHYDRQRAQGLNPTVPNQKSGDVDGDGLSNWQEYNGMDGLPQMIEAAFTAAGVHTSRVTSADALNPLDVDTDYDLLLDPFEVAWYNAAKGLDPAGGIAWTGVNATAAADPDADGLSNYREMSLHPTILWSGVNSNLWLWPTGMPYRFEFYATDTGTTNRFCAMWMLDGGAAANLNFGLEMTNTMTTDANLLRLRGAGWLSPTNWDSDSDWLPDGWEVEYNLNPLDATGANGRFGDPDGDGLWNYEEYLGQDGARYDSKPYVNGTGDETNPNEHNWRPDTTYMWRWFPTNMPYSWLPDPRNGRGISRAETLGSALPTRRLGVDDGADSDDDGLSDAAEIHRDFTNGILGSSPVHSCDPFLPKAALITSAAGIPIPDPEPTPACNTDPAGRRRDLQQRDWTIECMVNLKGNNLSGYLFNYETGVGGRSMIVYRLALVNNKPVLTAHNSDGAVFTVEGNALPTNQWIHLAGSWDHVRNALSLYIQGVLVISRTVYGECASSLMLPATNALALAVSADGSFVNRLLLDEVRIWGVARTAEQISDYARRLAPQSLGDDVWIDCTAEGGAVQYYVYRYSDSDHVLINGGSLFEGEWATSFASNRINGVLLTNAVVSFKYVPGQAGTYVVGEDVWLDNGDFKYNAAYDVILKNGGSLSEGELGATLRFLWNQQTPARVVYADKDNSGNFTYRSLLAYYRFDDGGATAEDFARKAQNGLLGAAAENLPFGDFGYALPVSGFSWNTNAAPVLGCDYRGADDSDRDGLPDGWEVINHLNPYDDGTIGESAPGRRDGPNGAQGDPDADGLVNLYEFWEDTNPRNAESYGTGRFDVHEDRDGDGVNNLQEQLLGGRPDTMDTDDDGYADNEEIALGTGMDDPEDPPMPRSMEFGGAASDYLDVPLTHKQRLTDWTIESWVYPRDAAEGVGTIIRRAVENLGGGNHALNYVLGLEPDGFGGLRMYAGYVLANGTTNILRGADIPAGQWTHLAAVYNSTAASLTLYRNGSAVASNNTFFTAPPINGKGGETFVRFGEDFAGYLDDVRIWSTVRTPAEITQYYPRVVSYAATGLVHSFRLDDGQANTNAFPFGRFHRPRGAQDYVYSEDWNDQWRHAAVSVGNVAFNTNNASIIPPVLRVFIEPPDAVTAGAKWALDNGTWLDSGYRLESTAGSHELFFKPLNGWNAPANETIALTNGAVSKLTRYYRLAARISVTLSPDEAVDAGAQWRLDSGMWRASGEVVTNVPPGPHTIDYAHVNGWVEPLMDYLIVAEGDNISLLRTYRPDLGKLVVNIAPPEVVVSGAQWRVNGGRWFNPAIEYPLPSGSYTVEFKRVEGWLAPMPTQVSITNDVTTILDASYYVPRYIGQYGTAGFGFFYKPRSIAVDDQDNLYIADSGNHRIQVFNITTEMWTVWGSLGSAVGQFNQPCGLALDRFRNIYVADANNNRIQKRDVRTGAWTAWGGPGVGSANGQFSMPYDVALDSTGTLYVADHYNNRVQKMSPLGVWSTLVFPGFYKGYVRAPSGLAVDTSNRIYVADYYTSAGVTNCRIQVFNNTGGLVRVAADSSPTNGALLKVRGLAVPSLDRLLLADPPLSRILYRLMPWGSFGQVLGTNDLIQAEDVAVDRHGNMFIADTLNHRVIMLQNAVPQVHYFTNATPLLTATNQFRFKNDYDGDGQADVAVFNPRDGAWYIKYSSDASLHQYFWGWSATWPVPGDYDGDGLTDLAVYCPENGTWYIWQTKTASMRQQVWGWNGANPVPGDYDGDKLTDLAVFDTATGDWYVWQSKTATSRRQNWGWGGTMAVPGDYDGDKVTDFAIFDGYTGNWYVLLSKTLGMLLQNWGWRGTLPVPADYDGDNRTDFAVFYPMLGNWYVWESSKAMMRVQNWGWLGVTPVPADYDGDGKADLTVYDHQVGNWYIFESKTAGIRVLNWGWLETTPLGR